MTFLMIRVLCFLVIIVIGSALKAKISKKKTKMMVLIPFYIIMSGALFLATAFPIENLFLSFDSPEAVFHYCRSGKTEFVVNGHESCLISYRQGENEYSQIIIPKTKEGYKIPVSFRLETAESRDDYNIHSDMLHLSGTSVYYIRGTVFEDMSSTKIVDSSGNEVPTIELLEGRSFLFYMLAESNVDEYYYVMNGE